MDKKIEKSSFASWKILIIAFIVALLIGAFWRTETSLKNVVVTRERIITSVVRKASFDDYIPLRVRVEPFKSVYLDAIEGGRVEEVLVEEGDIVTKGQALLRLSNTKLQLDLISREAQVSEQLNNLRNTQLDIERNRLSLKRDLIELDHQIKQLNLQLKRRKTMADFIDQEQLETLGNELHYLTQRRNITLESQVQEEKMRLAQIKQLESNVSQLEKNLKIARSNLDNLLVKAPRSGRLTSFDLDVGESKSGGERLGQIDDVEQFKATGLVSEFYLNRLVIGQQAIVNISGEQYTLVLRKIYPQVKNNEFEIDLHFINKTPESIRRGQTLTPRLMLSDSEEVLLFDNGAFMQESAGTWVYVLDPTASYAQQRKITIGRHTPAQIEILSGLSAGETVLISSYSNLKSAEKITIEDK
ncbi:efflux RND transporter periplasmic adaptor subunit [Colwellia sp. RE-S-Sl-9]